MHVNVTIYVYPTLNNMNSKPNTLLTLCIFSCMQILIQDVSSDVFLAFLEYLYTDHSPIDDGDSFGILVVSNQYCVPRLLALCELYISKLVETVIRKSIKDAEIDIIGEWLYVFLCVQQVCTYMHKLLCMLNVLLQLRRLYDLRSFTVTFINSTNA